MDEATRSIDAFLRTRYQRLGHQEGTNHRSLMALWNRFRTLADPHFAVELCGGDESRFAQRVWEMLVADRLMSAGFNVSSADKGPDFLVEKDGKKIWVEAIAPDIGDGPNRLPNSYISPKDSEEIDIPYQQILLRWTAAISEKRKKYIDFIESGVIEVSDPYVIAINSCLLGRNGFIGASQYPAIVEVLFSVGPVSFIIDRETGEKFDNGRSYRPSVENKNKSDVSTSIFVRPDYSGISAIIATHIPPDDPTNLSNWVTVCNPHATHTLPPGWLGTGDSYVMRNEDDLIKIIQYQQTGNQ
ncbi:hypothetical protein [Azospirillum doebereinerae]